MFNFTKPFRAKELFKQADERSSSSPLDPSPPLDPEITISESSSIIGKICFQGLIKIDGLFEGEFEGGHTIKIGPNGFVKANLHDIDEVEVYGKIEGNIHARQRVVLKGSAHVVGNITSPFLSVDEGVSIIGEVSIRGYNA